MSLKADFFANAQAKKRAGIPEPDGPVFVRRAKERKLRNDPKWIRQKRREATLEHFRLQAAKADAGRDSVGGAEGGQPAGESGVSDRVQDVRARHHRSDGGDFAGRRKDGDAAASDAAHSAAPGDEAGIPVPDGAKDRRGSVKARAGAHARTRRKRRKG